MLFQPQTSAKQMTHITKEALRSSELANPCGKQHEHFIQAKVLKLAGEIASSAGLLENDLENAAWRFDSCLQATAAIIRIGPQPLRELECFPFVTIFNIPGLTLLAVYLSLPDSVSVSVSVSHPLSFTFLFTALVYSQDKCSDLLNPSLSPLHSDAPQGHPA